MDLKEANDGAAEGWALLAGGNRDYGLVTALPTTPTPAKGDTCKLLVDEATGKVWDLVYTAPGSSPWSKIGGPPLRAVDPNTREGTATTFQTTGSPSVTTPLAGDYRVNWGARRLGQGNIGAGDGGAVVCVFINAVEQAALTAEVRANDQHRGGPAPASEVVTIAASLAVQPRYKALNANGYRVDRMFVEIDPVRVG